MAEPSLQRLSGLAGIAIPGRFGANFTDAPPSVIREIVPLAAARIAARRGREAALADSFKGSIGLPLPQGPEVAMADGLSLIGVAPAQWLALAQSAAAAERLRHAVASAAGLLAFTDQSDALAVTEISGPRARDVLAKGCPVDLHPSVFAQGDAATTQIALIGCHLWQASEAPAYLLAVPRSFAASFWSWLTASAAEFGYLVEPSLSAIG